MIRDEDINKMTTEEIALKLKELIDENGSTPDLNNVEEIEDLEGDEDVEIVPDSDISEDELDDLLDDDDE
jgi:hypothetical protein